MINLFMISGKYNEYLFTTDIYFSDDFDTLQQLIEVNYESSGGRNLESDESPRIDTHPAYSDVIYLGSVNSFEEIPQKFPEHMI